MPILNRVAEMQDEVTGWRRHLHTIPELLYDVHQTPSFVEEKLKAFGCDQIVPGIGRTGVVGIIKGSQGDGPVIRSSRARAMGCATARPVVATGDEVLRRTHGRG